MSRPPSSRADRRRAQDIEQQASIADQQERPNVPPRPIVDRCPATLDPQPCDFSMRGTDGRYRCWYCCRVRP